MHSMSSKSSIPFETEGGAVDIGLAHDASQHHIHQSYFFTSLPLSTVTGLQSYYCFLFALV